MINITATNGQTFFHALSKPGTNLDNQSWVERKRRTVLHFGRASFYMGCKLRRQNKTIEKAFFLDEKEYAVHGGGFPLRVKGTEGIIAVVVVSGLRQDLDHMIIYDSLKEFLANYRQMQSNSNSNPGNSNNNINNSVNSNVGNSQQSQLPLQSQQMPPPQPSSIPPNHIQQGPPSMPHQQYSQPGPQQQPRKYPPPTLETVYQ